MKRIVLILSSVVLFPIIGCVPSDQRISKVEPALRSGPALTEHANTVAMNAVQRTVRIAFMAPARTDARHQEKCATASAIAECAH